MSGTKTFSTKISDFQLVNEILPLRDKILAYAMVCPDKLKDKYFAQIVDLALKWDKMFQDSLLQGGV